METKGLPTRKSFTHQPECRTAPFCPSHREPGTLPGARERVSTFASPQRTSTRSIPPLIDRCGSAPCRRDIDPSNIPSVSVTGAAATALCEDERNSSGDQTRRCEGSNAHARTDGRKISAPGFTHSERGICASEDALPATNLETTYPRIVDEVVNSQYSLQHK